MQIALQKQKSNRTGATLTEVLMSLLIFSVGIVSVFTLFPVSLLSSIQATKLTNSKILADNVVEFVRASPGILHPPGTRSDTDTNEWTGEWKFNQSYSVGDLVWPRIKTGNLFPSPNLVFRCTTAGTSGGIEPRWQLSGTFTEGGGSLEWQTLGLSTTSSHYVVDPLGRHIEGDDTRKRFGFDGGSEITFGNGALSRTDGFFGSFLDALPVFTQPDSWTTVFEVVPDAVTATSVTVPANIDLNAVVNQNFRVVVISADRTQSVVRNLATSNTVVNQTINLVNPPNLPGNMDSASEVSTIRLEAFAPRYSYLMTVRRTSPFIQPKVSVVILFNRSFNLVDDEEVYDANFGNLNFTDDATVEDPNLSLDQLKVAWDGENRPPLLREGNFVFDARAALWYRITNIQRNDLNENAILTLDRPVEVQTTSAVGVGRAIFLPGIVNVFEL